ncbi:MAG: butyrate kinase [Ectothiorhodospiraceae bacterium]|nr:butyrate kinase [Ectothiorhodospiraceae bacterium]
MAQEYIILAINPGSTSTKIALFDGTEPFATASIDHTPPDGGIWDEFESRLAQIRAKFEEIRENRVPNAVVGRGGLLKPLKGGTYTVDENMITDARANLQGEHAANLGCAFAQSIAADFGVPAFTVDPICTDEFEPVARYSGLPQIERRALAHTLNMHAVARKAANALGIPYGESAFVVAHLGGGISIGPVVGGRIIDVNDASSNGPFSPDRTGTLPLQPFIKLCFSGEYDAASMKKLVMGKGGLIAYLGTNNLIEIEERIANGDTKAKEVVEAMCYQIAKEIGNMAAAIGRKPDGIIMTGGLSKSDMVYNLVKDRVEWIAPMHNYAGEHEMLALAEGTLRVLTNEETAKQY